MTSEPDISVFRPDRPGIRKVLGDLEAEIMELVWSRPEGSDTTVRDVFEVLYERRLSTERRRIAYTTVMQRRKPPLREEKGDIDATQRLQSADCTQDAGTHRWPDRDRDNALRGRRDH